jgi:aminoglycoside/choline kinase family phosphotransferase
LKKQLYTLFNSLYKEWSNEDISAISPLPQSGSSRAYFRMYSASKQAIGVHHTNKHETRAFILFTNFFLEKGLPVPEIYAKDPDHDIYIIQDLGNQSVFDKVLELKQKNDFQEIFYLYVNILKELPKFQIVAGKEFNYDWCYPGKEFDRQSVMWDLNYFKYNFLKLAHIRFDESRLEEDFKVLADAIEMIDRNFFMYRDFQSRNIMIQNEYFYFIDYQGGRKGSLQYDLASLLFESKTNLPFDIKEQLLDFYINELEHYMKIDRDMFIPNYYICVLVRLLQAFGAYGYRGLYEQKSLFIESIPYGLNNLSWLLNHEKISLNIPELKKVLLGMTGSDYLNRLGKKSESLTIHINSFSYRNGIPIDPTGNGGGFVFDCRLLPNPGLQEEYKTYYGTDKKVIDFLESKEEVVRFADEVKRMIEQTIFLYKKKGYTDLTVHFGCTGGQHRSVYMAHCIASFLQDFHDVCIDLHHLVKDKS